MGDSRNHVHALHGLTCEDALAALISELQKSSADLGGQELSSVHVVLGDLSPGGVHSRPKKPKESV